VVLPEEEERKARAYKAERRPKNGQMELLE
jgi:hypothetical protein